MQLRKFCFMSFFFLFFFLCFFSLNRNLDRQYLSPLISPLLRTVLTDRSQCFEFKTLSHTSTLPACHPPQTGSLKIAIVSLSSDSERMGKIREMSGTNKQEYADFHGYKFFDESDLVDQQEPPKEGEVKPKAGWLKIQAVEKHLSHFDWIFWTDADVLILNQTVPLEQFLGGPFDFVITEDSHGLNSGLWFIKNTPWSFKLLRLWLEQQPRFTYTSSSTKNGDNDALITLVDQLPIEDKAHLKVYPRCAFNSNGWPRIMNSYAYVRDELYVPGDFIIHFSGHPNKEQAITSFFPQSSKQNKEKD